MLKIEKWLEKLASNSHNVNFGVFYLTAVLGSFVTVTVFSA